MGGMIFVAKLAETFRMDVLLGLHFYGDDLALPLYQKVHFRRAALVGPIAKVVKGPQPGYLCLKKRI